MEKVSQLGSFMCQNQSEFTCGLCGPPVVSNLGWLVCFFNVRLTIQRVAFVKGNFKLFLI